MKTYHALLFAAGMTLATPQTSFGQESLTLQQQADTELRTLAEVIQACGEKETGRESQKEYGDKKHFYDYNIFMVETKDFATGQRRGTAYFRDFDSSGVRPTEGKNISDGIGPYDQVRLEDIGQQGEIEFTIGAPTNNSIHTYAEAKYMSDALLVLLRDQYELYSVHSLSRKSNFTSKACVQQLKKRFPNLR